MYRVALIQNQSEMSHYGYADVRALLKEFGYQVSLYTAQNIDDLPVDLIRYDYNAIIFASNALNDKKIRNLVISNEFIEAFNKFINNGKGCLILHQLRMAQDGLSLDFLPNNLKQIQPQTRNDEPAIEGDLKLSSIAKDHIFLLYPNLIKIQQIKNQCLSYNSLKGLYWHFWDNVSNNEWDVVLFDYDKNGIKRPLIVSSKESYPFRIVLSSLTLDWQKQKNFLQNILTVLVEGKHRTAILKDSQNRNTGFDYLIERLKSLQFPYRIYDKNESLGEFERNVSNGVHSIVVFGPFVDPDKIDYRTSNLIKSYVNEGKLKTVCISQDDDENRFYIEGRERFALRLLYDIELKIQQELHSGYIDDSFWSTIESLQILDEMQIFTKSKYDEKILEPVINLANNYHDKSGSYDEVFGVTCAFLWLRAKILGKSDNNTQRTLSWIKSNFLEYEDREKALAYYTIIKTGLATDDDKIALKNILIAKQDKLDFLSDIDLIEYLRAAIVVNFNDIIVPIITRLEKSQEDGFWIDIETTAKAINTLLDALFFLQEKEPNFFAKIRIDSESIIFKSIINIQNSLQDTSSEKITYPWDNKASTSLKCIQAWLKFEKLINLPVLELVDVLTGYSIMERLKSSSVTSLTILEELGNENREINEESIKLKLKIDSLENNLKVQPYLWICMLASLYILFSIIVFLWMDDVSVTNLFKTIIFNYWEVHILIIGFAIAIYKIIPIILKKGNK